MNVYVTCFGTIRFNVSIITRFNVNFHAGQDIAFHFDVRFHFGSDCNQIVRNAMQHNTWGHEEREVSNFPFQPDKFFDMIILVEPHCFKVQ